MNKKHLYIFAAIILFLTSCSNNNPTPRPKAYFRIDTPEKSYKSYNSECPFTFEMPDYAFIIKDKNEFCWFDIWFPANEATVYLTYKPINKNLNVHIEDSHEFVYKHVVKADAIEETPYENDSLNVYGMLYELKGNTASPIQFFLTDSTTHFLRGSLYFDVRPNKDSLAPVIEFIREDIIHLMESLQWK